MAEKAEGSVMPVGRGRGQSNSKHLTHEARIHAASLSTHFIFACNLYSSSLYLWPIRSNSEQRVEVEEKFVFMCCNLKEVLIFTDNSSTSGGHGKESLMWKYMRTVRLLKRERKQ